MSEEQPTAALASARIVVLGAGGLIGRRIVSALAACDWACPVAAIRGPNRYFDADIETIVVDATSAAELATGLRGASGVVNAIAGPPATLVDNARALFTVAAAANEHLRVVHLSTMSVYGAATGRLSEDSPLTAQVDAYGAAKREAEQLARACPNVVVLRPGIVYGPESPLWSKLIGDLLVAGRLGDLGAAGRGGCNLVHVDDVAQAAVLALRLQVEGRTTATEGHPVFNLAAPPVVTWNDYFREYATALGIAEVPIISPLRLALERTLAGPMLKAAELALGPERLPPPIRPWLTNLCRHEIVLDAGRAETELGVHYTPLTAGLAETAAWYQRQPGRRSTRRSTAR